MSLNVSNDGKTKYSETRRIICEAQRDKQLVLFVGAGLSFDAGMPLWKEAVKQIADRLGIKDEEHKDYLKIPQYYYNMRGSKEYNQLMRKIFKYKEKLSTQPAHKLLMKFDVDTIITTNYDLLIEQAAEENNEFIQVISCDNELPYRKAGKELIKMHGDFEHNNFVLKEDDYYEYHNNFKLIENYVKSIIGSKVVLFLGYSLDDPDVKHIFSWVKDILKNDFQRAYMIDPSDRYDIYKVEYFKNLGINLICTSDLLERGKSTITERFCSALKYLQDDEEKQSDTVSEVYDKLKILTPLNYIYRKSISRAFRFLGWSEIQSIYEEDGYVYFLGNNDITNRTVKTLKSILNGQSKKEEFADIYSLLSKSSFKGIVHNKYEIKSERYNIKSKENPLKWFDSLLAFDYKELWELKEYNYRCLSESKPELYMLQAYLCSFFGDYLSAYNCLDNVSKYFYRKRMHVWYFISVWNKYNIGKIIDRDTLYNHVIDKEELDKIRSEIKAINLDLTIRSLPVVDNEDYGFLYDLVDFKFSSDLFYDVFSDSVKVSKEAKESYIFYTGLPSYGKLSTKVYDYYNYCTLNYLIVDRYRENSEIYNLFTRSILASVAAPDIKNVTDIGLAASSNIHAKHLDKKDIHLILRYIDSENLEKLFNEFRIKTIKINEEGLEYLKILANNLSELFNIPFDRKLEIYNRFLSFISHVAFDSELAQVVIKTITEIIDKVRLVSIKNPINEFLMACYRLKLYGTSKICEDMRRLGEKAISLVSQKEALLDDIYYIIKNSFYFCFQGGIKIDNVSALMSIIDDQYINLIADIYTCCDEPIKDIIRSAFLGWKCPDTGTGYNQYYNAVISGLIKSDSTIECKAFSYIKKSWNAKQKQQKKGIYSGGGLDLERSFANLYLQDLLINKESFKEIVNAQDDDVLKWLMDWINYDYTKFDASWLSQCSPQLLEKIATKPKVKKAIVNAYKEGYKKDATDPVITDIIIDHFI